MRNPEMLPLFLVWLLSAGVALTSAALRLDTCSKLLFKLPINITSTHYHITLDVDLARDTFEGEVEILVKVGQREKSFPRNQIAFHASNKLSLGNIQLKNAETGERLEIVEACAGINDVNVVTLREDLPAHSSSLLRITYTGSYADAQETGFFKTTSGGHRLAATNLERGMARSVLPCLDEAHTKSKFDLTIVHGPQEQVLASTQQVSEERLAGGRVRSQFATTPSMSPQLLGFVVGRFEYLEQVVAGTKMRFYTAPGRSRQVKLALDLAKRALPFVEDYFGAQFPLDKLDLVALEQGSTSVIINSGLVFVLEQHVFANSESHDLEYLAQTVLRAVYQQWRGNVVDWWNKRMANQMFNHWVEYTVRQLIAPQPTGDMPQPSCFGPLKKKARRAYHKIRHVLF